MGLDQTKTFMKHHSELIPSEENVLGVIIAEPKGGAWRRGMSAAGSIPDAIAGAAKLGEPQQATDGDASTWPGTPAMWVVVTDKQLHAFGGQMSTTKLSGESAHYPYDRIDQLRLDKKLLISALHVSFKDGSSLELGIAKQKTKPFVEAIESRFATP